MFFAYYLFFFKQKTAYEMRISDWSSDVCSSDLCEPLLKRGGVVLQFPNVGRKPIDSGASEILDAPVRQRDLEHYSMACGSKDRRQIAQPKIGRASWRERGCTYV